MALINEMDYFYLFDSHARDFSGMPNPNGIAVVMKFTNIVSLKQYLYFLSMELHTKLFEIVPVQLDKCIASEKKESSPRKLTFTDKLDFIKLVRKKKKALTGNLQQTTNYILKG